jgi:hypothetical protein
VVYFHNALLQKSLRPFEPAQIGFAFSKLVSRRAGISRYFLPDMTKKPCFLAFCEMMDIVLP